MIDSLIKDFLILWTTIDPIGALAIFAALTASKSAQERRRIAGKSVIYAFGILLASIVLGQFVLVGMGIKLISLQLAGGIILFIFGLKMVFGNVTEEFGADEKDQQDIAVFPMAVPAIATPGAIMAAIILTDNNVHAIVRQAMTAGLMAAVLVITYGMLLLSNGILKIIGQNGAAILVKVMGMLLAAFSVELVMDALGVTRWLGVQ